MGAKKLRLDDALVKQGYFADREAAARAVMAGLVSARGERLTKPGTPVAFDAPLHVKGSQRSSRFGQGSFVSRGGIKLEGALRTFALDPSDFNCLDIGCSTGGFTDCLLKMGARRVAAVDVGYGQFDWGLRRDSRVALFERTNICDAGAEELGAPFDLVVADVSFTAVERIAPKVCEVLSPGGLFCTLVKPQFEAERSEVGEGGVVRDPAVHRRVLKLVADGLSGLSLGVQRLCVSPIHGAKGNIEFFMLARSGFAARALDIDAVVCDAWASSALQAGTVDRKDTYHS